MGIAAPRAIYEGVDKATISGIPGVGSGKIIGYTGKTISRYGQTVLSKLFQQGLKTKSRAAGTGAGIGLGISTLFESGTTPTSGDEQQGGPGYYSVSSKRRYKYRRRISKRCPELHRCSVRMPCRCKNF